MADTTEDKAGVERMTADELMDLLKAMVRGDGSHLNDTIMRNLAKRGINAQTLLYAAKLCHSVSGGAPHYTGYSRGASECHSVLAVLGERLGKYLDEHGR